MEECLFCKIASGEIPSAVIYADEDAMAFLDIRPANPGHTLVMPKKHYQILPQLPDALNTKIMQLLKVMVRAQVEALGAEGVNVLQNNGAVAGQAVNHIHFHVIPRFKGDKVIFNWEPKELKKEQFAEIQKRLSERAKEGVVIEQPKPEVIEEQPVARSKEKVKQRLP